jgi:hypothetical protein
MRSHFNTLICFFFFMVCLLKSISEADFFCQKQRVGDNTAREVKSPPQTIKDVLNPHDADTKF